jgi:hypothetical protein
MIFIMEVIVTQGKMALAEGDPRWKSLPPINSFLLQAALLPCLPVNCGRFQQNFSVDIQERFFFGLQFDALARKISRAIQKERKIYLWDIPRIKDPAARFENRT